MPARSHTHSFKDGSPASHLLASELPAKTLQPYPHPSAADQPLCHRSCSVSAIADPQTRGSCASKDIARQGNWGSKLRPEYLPERRAAACSTLPPREVRPRWGPTGQGDPGEPALISAGCCQRIREAMGHKRRLFQVGRARLVDGKSKASMQSASSISTAVIVIQDTQLYPNKPLSPVAPPVPNSQESYVQFTMSITSRKRKRPFRPVCNICRH